ncbi:unnamed protein product, partial [Rangifer tarandus platyrhynchus]
RPSNSFPKWPGNCVLLAASLVCSRGFPGGSDGKESACQCSCGFNPWARKIPWRRE